jgi:hypothetical protein
MPYKTPCFQQPVKIWNSGGEVIWKDKGTTELEQWIGICQTHGFQLRQPPVKEVEINLVGLHGRVTDYHFFSERGVTIGDICKAVALREDWIETISKAEGKADAQPEVWKAWVVLSSI